MRPETIRTLRDHTEAREVVNRMLLAQWGGADDAPEHRAAVERLAELDKAVGEAFKTEEADAADREADPKFRDLIGGVELRAYMAEAASGRPVKGRELEVREELELGEGAVPYAALLTDEERIEMRADVATTVPADAKGKPRQSIVPRVFQRSDAAFFGVQMPTAPRGFPIYPVLTAGAAGSMANAGVHVDSEAATFTATQIEPTRATAAYTLRAEETATFEGLEAVLRADLRQALSKLMDDNIVSTTGAAPELDSLIDHATADPGTDPTQIANLETLDKLFTDGIDGLYAYGREGVRLFVSTATEKFLGFKRHDETAQTYGQMLNGAGGTRRASNRVGQKTAAIQRAYRFVPNELRAFAPVWEGFNLIRDPYSDASKGQVRITALMLFGFDIVRGTITTNFIKIA